jgi:hypothetical protein
MLPTSFLGWIFVIPLMGWFAFWLFRLSQQWGQIQSAIVSIDRLRQMAPSFVDYTAKLQEMRAKGTILPNFPSAEAYFDSVIKQAAGNRLLVGAVKNHFRTIFLAGANESVLEASELIASTKEDVTRASRRLLIELGAFILLGLLATVWVLGNSGFSPFAERSFERQSSAPAVWGLLAAVIGGAAYARFREQRLDVFSSALSRTTVSEWIPALYPTVGHKAARWALETFQHAAIVTDAAKTIEHDTVLLRDALRQAKEATAEFTRGVQTFQQFAAESERSLANSRSALAQEISNFATALSRWSAFETEIRRYYAVTAAGQQATELDRVKRQEWFDVLRRQIEQSDQRLTSLLDHYRRSVDELILPVTQVERRLAGLGEPFQKAAAELTEIATNLLKLNRNGAAQVASELADMKASIQRLGPIDPRTSSGAKG